MADERATHKALIAQLREEDAFIEFPAEAEANWSLEDIQTFYDTCGEILPESTVRTAGSEQVQAESANEATTAGTAPVQLGATNTEPGASLEEMRAELKQKLLQQKNKN